jgi:hypothetical protein
MTRKVCLMTRLCHTKRSPVNGLGASFGRTLIENPAWRRVGVKAWAEFSRAADLGNGEIVYPLEGIGGMLLIVAGAISFRLSSNRPLSAIPIYGAALMKVGILLVTTQAKRLLKASPRRGVVAVQNDGGSSAGNTTFSHILLQHSSWSLHLTRRMQTSRMFLFSTAER